MDKGLGFIKGFGANSGFFKHSDFIFSISNLDLSAKKAENKEKLIAQSVIAKQTSLGFKILYRSLGLFFLFFSLLIIFSEITLVFGSHDEVLAFSKIVKSTGKNSLFLLQVILILVFLFYLVFCAYFALFRMEVGLTFDLTVYQTHAISMMRGSTTCLNLAFPLCYNLMTLFNEINPYMINGQEYTSAFAEFFVPMRKVPFFGDHYNTIVPLLIAIIGFFTAFKFFGRLLARATKGLITIDVSEHNPEKISKGEKVILAEFERRKRKIRSEEISTQRSEITLSSQKPNPEALIIHPEPLNTPPESRKISEISSLSITKVLPPVALDIELDSRLTEEQVSEIQHQEILSKEIEMEIRDIEIKGKADDYEEFRGVLLKKGKLGTWKEWYFCVVGPSLCYYESAKLQKKKGEYEISKIKSIGMQGSKKKKNKGKKLQINMEKNQVILKAKNEQEAKKWEEYLNYVVQMYQINNI